MHISFEVYPPKKEGSFETAFDVVERLSRLAPEFISVTYGAGGSESKKTLDIASYIQNECNTDAVAHLTCIGNTHEEILAKCREFREKSIHNVLALRGDRPKNMADEQFNRREFAHATDMIRFLKENSELQIMAACYPEKHFEAASMEEDLRYMKEKQDLGVESFLSQLFFDNGCFYRFREQARQIGIMKPICAGIMPITSVKQIGTTVKLSGSSVPKRLADIIAKYSGFPEDMYKAGIDYAVGQISDLQNNSVDGIHIYTMNQPKVAEDILVNLQ